MTKEYGVFINKTFCFGTNLKPVIKQMYSNQTLSI